MNLYDRVVKLENAQKERDIEYKLRQEKDYELHKTQRIILAVTGSVLILTSFLPLILSYLTISKISYTNFTFFNVLQKSNSYLIVLERYFWFYFVLSILLLICGLICIKRASKKYQNN